MSDAGSSHRAGAIFCYEVSCNNDGIRSYSIYENTGSVEIRSGSNIDTMIERICASRENGANGDLPIIKRFFHDHAVPEDVTAVRKLVELGLQHAAFKLIIMTANARIGTPDFNPLTDSAPDEELFGDALFKASNPGNETGSDASISGISRSTTRLNDSSDEETSARASSPAISKSKVHRGKERHHRARRHHHRSRRISSLSDISSDSPVRHAKHRRARHRSPSANSSDSDDHHASPRRLRKSSSSEVSGGSYTSHANRRHGRDRSASVESSHSHPRHVNHRHRARDRSPFSVEHKHGGREHRRRY